jgi:hypothetical protein
LLTDRVERGFYSAPFRSFPGERIGDVGINLLSMDRKKRVQTRRPHQSQFGNCLRRYCRVGGNRFGSKCFRIGFSEGGRGKEQEKDEEWT